MFLNRVFFIEIDCLFRNQSRVQTEKEKSDFGILRIFAGRFCLYLFIHLCLQNLLVSLLIWRNLINPTYFRLGNEQEENCVLFVFKSSIFSNQDLNYSYLIGFAEIKYHKDNYFLLCEYLFHSVYDSKSLEDFDINEYLQYTNTNQYSEDINSIQESPFSTYYSKSFTDHNLDDRLTKSSKLIQLPPDWTLLGQLFYLNKGKRNYVYEGEEIYKFSSVILK